MAKNKTLHELAKEFPEKTYRELEKYRDADRVEEAIGIGHNQPPDEGEEQDNPTLWDIATTHNVSYADAVSHPGRYASKERCLEGCMYYCRDEKGQNSIGVNEEESRRS